MDIRKLQRAIVDGLEDVKAQDIVVFNTEHLSAMFERVIIASGTSNRQTKALASSVRNAVKQRGLQVMRTEGEDNGEWIIVDCGAAVAHIMQPAIREYYHLEEIWGGKPVKLRLDSEAKGLPKASEEEDEPAPAKKAPAKKTAASKRAATKTAAKKAVAKKAAAKKSATADTPAGKVAIKKTAAKKAAAKKTTSTKAGVSRTTGVKRSSVAVPAPVSAKKVLDQRAPAKKVAAKKAAAKKVVPRKTAATKVPARKAPAR